MADDPSPLARTTSSFAAFPSSPSAVSQSLSSILNNPHANRSDASWSLWWPSAPAAAPDFAPLPPSPFPPISRSDFLPYITYITASHSRFEDIRIHNSLTPSPSATPGNALIACLREVPSLFFNENFSLEDGGTFQLACPFSASEEANLALQERLTQYLDVVEMHLVREIALRSDSFFEAQGQLQGLNGEIVEACGRIRGLKETIRILTGNLVGSARSVKELNATRGNLVVLQEKLTVIMYVSQAMAALKLLVAAGDCAGALDVTDDLQHLLDTDELAGLHCFRHLRDQLAASLDSINSILSAEFLRAAIHDAKIVDSMILSKIKTRAANHITGIQDDVNVDDDEICTLRDRLLPLIVGLLRTARLPAVLRIYRDTLIMDMKSAIKTTVAELLPVLLGRPSESDQVTGEHITDSEVGVSLAGKLRSLSSESFVLLLGAIFKVVQAHLTRAGEVKRVIEWIMGNLDGCYAADGLPTIASHGGAAFVAADIAREDDNLITSPMQNSFPRNTPKITLIQGKVNDGSSPNTSKNFRADVLRENTEAVFAACDAAHGRWAKLLGVRALLHPKLRLLEFLSIYDITQEFIAATEKIGGRLGYSIRGTLQSQSKAFVDFQHESRMTKIKAVLDQETWVAVDVPEEFQAIVASLSSTQELPTNNEPVSINGSSSAVDSETLVTKHPLGQNGTVESSADYVRQKTSLSLPVPNPDTRAEATSIGNTDVRKDEQARATSQTLVYGGVGYHMVNCGLILFKMLSEYVDISRCLPALSSEVVHRVMEILKLFNTRTCQLVLGAGAMQVSGLKSITSKHLALASQIIGFIYVIIPEIRRVLFLKMPEARKGMLLSEIDRVAQDYKLHRDEIHTKLVQIMRERLFANLRKLPQIVASWNGQEDNDLQPSQFARAVTKEVTYLHRILSQILLEDDVHAIFRQVVQIFHSHITEAFSKLDVSTPQARNRLCRDIQHILGCIRKLPSDISSKDKVPNFGLLDEFLAEKFGTNVGQ